MKDKIISLYCKIRREGIENVNNTEIDIILESLDRLGYEYYKREKEK